METENILAIDISIEEDDVNFEFMNEKLTDRISLSRGPEEWSDLSFVIERKPGADCHEDLKRGVGNLQVRPVSCFGELHLRELGANEKAKAAQTKSGKRSVVV